MEIALTGNTYVDTEVASPDNAPAAVDTLLEWGSDDENDSDDYVRGATHSATEGIAEGANDSNSSVAASESKIITKQIESQTRNTLIQALQDDSINKNEAHEPEEETEEALKKGVEKLVFEEMLEEDLEKLGGKMAGSASMDAPKDKDGETGNESGENVEIGAASKDKDPIGSDGVEVSNCWYVM